MIQVGSGTNERPLALGHLLTIDGEEAMNMDERWKREFCRLEHRGPEERVKVRDVLADKVMHFSRRRTPPIFKFLTMLLAPLPARSHVADWSVEPHVPIVARTIGNLKAEIRRRPRNIPITQGF